MASKMPDASVDTITNLSTHKPRAYQNEMLRESLKRNIIVAMDTGSGKTNVAVLRIAEEVKKCSVEKLCWFLCPNVELAIQQHGVLEAQLPSVPCRLLLGRDGVDYWKSQNIWDDVLKGYRAVVSTYQVLLDALKHGFVSMTRLALLVVDEAHHCAGNSPMYKIMHEHYHRCKTSGRPVPAILGLTATPVMKTKVEDLKVIEANLDAISRTPKESLEELMEHVNRPHLTAIVYDQPPIESVSRQSSYSDFRTMFETVNIHDDPSVILLATNPNVAPRDYNDAVERRKTRCQGVLRSINSNAATLHDELGSWASHRYLVHCRRNLRAECERNLLMLGADQLYMHETQWLESLLANANIPTTESAASINSELIAPKTIKLIDVLEQEMSTNSAAIVFVKTKATVQYLAQLLASDSRTAKLLRVGKLVGLSSHTERRKDIGSVLELDEKAKSSLKDLKSGKKNILVCTSVAEEGLDISSCNLVVCFERPRSLKSFVQRRGRARAKDSKFVVMFNRTESETAKDFAAAENQMREMYADDMRVLEKRLANENQEMDVSKEICAKTGDARLTLDDAVPHLHHFCSALPQGRFNNARPIFTFDGTEDQIECTVTLPNSLDASLRNFTSPDVWPTEGHAKKDAALTAYRGLYEAGLLNENLLPGINIGTECPFDTDKSRKEGIIEARAQRDPFQLLAAAWVTSTKCYQYSCIVPSRRIRMFLFLPVQLTLPTLSLVIDKNETIECQFEFRGCREPASAVDLATQSTREILWSMYQSRMDKSWSGFPILIAPSLDMDDCQSWLSENIQLLSLQQMLDSGEINLLDGETLIRRRNQEGRPMLFASFENHEAKCYVDGNYVKQVAPCVKCYKWPSRTDFTHPVSADNPDQVERFSYIPLNEAVVDKMPLQTVFFASLMPSIMHHVGRRFLGQDLCKTLLAPIGLDDIDLVLEAITATVAREDVNYQRIEYLGDSLLSICVGFSLLAEFPLWHEGYLSEVRSHFVSNLRLSQSAEASGLTRYILTTLFTGAKWRPPHYDQHELEAEEGRREMSLKTCADVVEALIGVAYLANGIEASVSTINALISRPSEPISWKPLDLRVAELQSRILPMDLPPHFEPLQTLIGYTFVRPACLIEAMTHSSYSPECGTSSYERFEFAGDSILHLLVSRFIFSHEPALPVDLMHLLRTAAVNAHFLAFTAMRLTASVKTNEIVKPDVIDRTKENGGYTTREVETQVFLSNFILHDPSWGFTAAKSNSLQQFETHRVAIEAELDAGKRYPWTLLAMFSPEKFFSDVIESLLCAIFIDSGGNFDACLAFLQKLGIMSFLECAIGSGMRMLQPKQELNHLTGTQDLKAEYIAASVDDDGLWDELEPGELVETTHRVACRVMVGDRRIATAFGREKFEAETKAADKALTVLKNEGFGWLTKKKRTASNNEMELDEGNAPMP